jgi:hypothetical protein
MEVFSGYYPKLTFPDLSLPSDTIIEGESTQSSGTVVTIHGCIRATPLVALCGKHWSTNEIPGAERGARAAKKRSATFPGVEPRLHNDKTPPWRPREKQTSPNRGRQIWQTVFPLGVNGGKLGETRNNHQKEKLWQRRFQKK